jgi:hypothetical protein
VRSGSLLPARTRPTRSGWRCRRRGRSRFPRRERGAGSRRCSCSTAPRPPACRRSSAAPLPPGRLSRRLRSGIGREAARRGPHDQDNGDACQAYALRDVPGPDPDIARSGALPLSGRFDILRRPEGRGFQPRPGVALLVRGSSPCPTAQEGSPRCHRMPCGGPARQRLGYRRRLTDGIAVYRQNGGAVPLPARPGHVASARQP